MPQLIEYYQTNPAKKIGKYIKQQKEWEIYLLLNDSIWEWTI